MSLKLLKVFPIVITTITACSSDDCDPTACVYLTPTAQDIGATKMYKSGTTYKFLLNGKDTLSFIASDVNYYEGFRDNGNGTDGCNNHYASHVYAKVRLAGTNNNRHMNFVLATWRRTTSKNLGIDQICALTLEKDSSSIFYIERENPKQTSVEEVTDMLLFSRNTTDGFKAAGKSYDDVYHVTDMSSPIYFRFYYNKEYGLLKFTTSSGETLELIQ